ncbi:MAG TPA: hypothetical protein VI546_04310 [candidate division Zixibacteria bacterium]|nr:hypothetical protein [candidate division Zixibacteria bacterium]
MSKIKAAFVLFGLSLVLGPGVFADSPEGGDEPINPPLHPKLEILAETIWVNVKNRQAVTKVFLVVKNPNDHPLATGFRFPLSDKDTLVDFGVSQRSEPVLSNSADSSPPLAVLSDSAESSDSTLADSQASRLRLAPGETVSVMLLYQTAPDTSAHRLRYVFPLKESFITEGAIRSFAFYADIDEKTRIMEVKTENYPIVVRGNGPKRQIYFYQNHLRPKADIGFSYRAAPPKKEKEL